LVNKYRVSCFHYDISADLVFLVAATPVIHYVAPSVSPTAAPGAVPSVFPSDDTPSTFVKTGSWLFDASFASVRLLDDFKIEVEFKYELTFVHIFLAFLGLVVSANCLIVAYLILLEGLHAACEGGQGSSSRHPFGK
jgi:hypothetical protein